MTDNEIMKALECCGKESCNGCPYRTKQICHQGNPMLRDALDLINRQNRWVDKWKDIAHRETKYFGQALTEINSLKAEIERLTSDRNAMFDKWLKLAEVTKKRYGELYKEAKETVKSEAIKEFVTKFERLADVISVQGSLMNEWRIDANAWDELIKEMTEGKDNA